MVLYDVLDEMAVSAPPSLEIGSCEAPPRAKLGTSSEGNAESVGENHLDWK